MSASGLPNVQIIMNAPHSKLSTLLNEANCSNVSRGKDSLTPTFRAIFCHLFLATPTTHLQESEIFMVYIIYSEIYMVYMLLCLYL